MKSIHESKAHHILSLRRTLLTLELNITTQHHIVLEMFGSTTPDLDAVTAGRCQDLVGFWVGANKHVPHAHQGHHSWSSGGWKHTPPHRGSPPAPCWTSGTTQVSLVSWPAPCWWPGLFPEVLSSCRLPFPSPDGWGCWDAPSSSTGDGRDSCYQGLACSARSNGSRAELGPGRYEIYCQGSPHFHARSSDAASSILNWMSYSCHAELSGAFWWRFSTVCRWATMLGIVSEWRLAITAKYNEKHVVHVSTSSTRRWDLWCSWVAWNWLRAPTKLSCSEGVGFPSSASRRERGAGRNSSMSTYWRAHAFSTSFIGSVGRPLATR